MQRFNPTVLGLTVYCVFKKYNRNYKPYYSKSLLLGERLEFVNDSLNKFFEVEGYRDEAFDKINGMDYRLFEYLNSLIQKYFYMQIQFFL
mgnify:CR=1 FL=1